MHVKGIEPRIADEHKAVRDYNKLIARAKKSGDDEAVKVVTHIRDEEVEHGKELTKLLRRGKLTGLMEGLGAKNE